MKKSVKTFSIPASGNSMHPLLQNGDIVEYIQVPFSSIKLNDIVLTYVNTVLVTHRVIYKTPTTCITRGDNNALADKPIKKARVVAKVTRFKRKGKWYGIQDAYTLQSSVYISEIQKFEILLRMKNIPHVFLKGVLVSLRYEGYIPKRIYADCDILVERSNQAKIDKTFRRLGYSLQKRSLLSSEGDPNTQPEVSYMKHIGGVPVVFDVHFEPVFLMTQIPGMNLLYSQKKLSQLGEELIRRAESKKIKEFTYSLCQISDQILYLTLHIFHHNFTDSVRYQLLDSVIRKKTSKKIWLELQDSIVRYQLGGYTYGVFLLLKRFYKTPIPDSFISSIRPPFIKLLVTNYVINHVDIFSQEGRGRAGIERFILIFFLSPEPYRKKILLLFHPNILITGYKILIGLLKIKK